MALKATKAEVWVATIEDRVGGAADKLEALARGGANLEMVLARRTEQPGQGVMFVTPVKGAKAVKAAQAAGFGKPANIHSVRVEGGDKPGLGSKITRALGNAGVSFRGVSAVAIGKKFISYIACDSAEDAAKAITVLKKL
ncbi:MAG TPA: amino acid-binding protein [Burkholderiales bacterium]|nr:amino acid-binding protein [Burkholderiales bacterium]